MRQHTINLYKFSELSSDAQRRAIEHVQSWPDLFGWCDEWRESLKAFCGHFFAGCGMLCEGLEYTLALDAELSRIVNNEV